MVDLIQLPPKGSISFLKNSNDKPGILFADVIIFTGSHPLLL